MSIRNNIDNVDRLFETFRSSDLDERGRARRDVRAQCGHLIRKGRPVGLAVLLKDDQEARVVLRCYPCSQEAARLEDAYTKR